MVNILLTSRPTKIQNGNESKNAFFPIDFSAFPLAFFSQHLGFFSLNVTNQKCHIPNPPLISPFVHCKTQVIDRG